MTASIVTLSLGQRSLSTLLSLGLPSLLAASSGSSMCRSTAWPFGWVTHNFHLFWGTHSLRRNRSFSDTFRHSSQQTTSYRSTQSSQKATFYLSTYPGPTYPPHLTTHHWARLFFLNSFLAAWHIWGIASKGGLHTKDIGSFFWINCVLWVRILYYKIRNVIIVLYLC